MNPALGELQDTSIKRIEAYKKGYMKGQPDIILYKHHKKSEKYKGLCIEFKTRQCNGVII